MDNGALTALIVIAGLVVLVGLWMWSRNRRSQEIRQHFGPEYEHTVAELGDPRKAEDELAARRRRVEKLDIRPLSQADFNQFSDEWRSVQAHFVDDPNAAIKDADLLVKELMETRGYPVGNFEQRAADISVHHPQVVEHYRAAHDAMPGWGKREATTEELRQAMVHYRALFEELLVIEGTKSEVA
jgi:ABC-type nickel/cobalt efflux system permease component RcnA